MFGFKSKRNKIRENTARAFENNIQVLKGMDDETIGQVLDLAAQIKSSSLLAAGDDPHAEALYHDPITVPDNISLEQLEIFQQMMFGWAREGTEGLAKVGALSVWYLSLAAGTFTEQRLLGCNLWAELSRGFSHTQLFDPDEETVIGLEPKAKGSTVKLFHFKDNQSAFACACKYHNCTLQKHAFLPALVKKVSNTSGGIQNLMLLVASDDGGISVIAQTLNNQVPHLKNGDFVWYYIAEYDPESPVSIGMIGFVVHKLQPVYDIEKSCWQIAQ